MASALQFMPRAQLQRLAHQATAFKRRIQESQEVAEKGLTVAIHGGEAALTAFGLGVVHARFGTNGEAAIGYGAYKLPVDLLAAGAGFVGGFFTKKHHEHLNAAAYGALGLYAGRMGMKFGQSAAAVKVLGAKPAVSGVASVASVSPIAAAAARA